MLKEGCIDCYNSRSWFGGRRQPHCGVTAVSGMSYIILSAFGGGIRRAYETEREAFVLVSKEGRWQKHASQAARSSSSCLCSSFHFFLHQAPSIDSDNPAATLYVLRLHHILSRRPELGDLRVSCDMMAPYGLLAPPFPFPSSRWPLCTP